MVLPAIALLVVFMVVPFFSAFLFSFTINSTFTDDKEGIYVGTEGISSSTDTVTSAISNGSLITRRGSYGAIIGTKYDSSNGYYLSLCGDYGVGVGVSTSVTKVVCGINPLAPTGSMYCKTLYADDIEIIKKILNKI